MRQVYMARGLGKRYGRKILLSNYSLQLTRGQVHAVLGPSGCGKTTLLRILSGLEHADEGSHDFPGHGKVAWLFQESRLLPWLTVAGNIAYILPDSIGQNEKSRRISELLEMTELSGHENHFPDELSGGMARRTALSRALAYRPEVLYLDEPFVGLDKALKETIARRTMDYCRNHGITVLWVTHDPALAEELADSSYEFPPV